MLDSAGNHVHEECYPCVRSWEGDGPDHNGCLQKCGDNDGPAVCPGPCACSCNVPLSRDEVARLRAMLEALR